MSSAAAVPLGYALVLRAADNAGVRALAIKGPVPALQGLSAPKVSVDVDVLVDPATLPLLQAEMERIGWRESGVDGTTPGIVPHHAANYGHPLWPYEVDLHHWFPGFLADPSHTFDVLWARRTTVDIAHVTVPAPDAVSSAAVMALNYLRDANRTHELTMLADVVRQEWSASQIADLAQLAADTGAAETMRPFFDQIGALSVASGEPLSVSLSDWEMRSQTRTTEVLPWLVGLRRTVWWRRPSFVWRALWLGDASFQSWDTSTPDSRRALMKARWQRILRARRALPLALTEYRRLRR